MNKVSSRIRKTIKSIGIFACMFLFYMNSGAQENPKLNIDTTLLLQHWVLNDKFNNGVVSDLTTLQFVTRELAESYDLPMHLKYAGFRFEKDNLFITFFWNKCGTGNPPNHHNAYWQLSNETGGYVVTISESSKWDGMYEIVELSNTSMKLVRL